MVISCNRVRVKGWAHVVYSYSDPIYSAKPQGLGARGQGVFAELHITRGELAGHGTAVCVELALESAGAAAVAAGTTQCRTRTVLAGAVFRLKRTRRPVARVRPHGLRGGRHANLARVVRVFLAARVTRVVDDAGVGVVPARLETVFENLAWGQLRA